MPLSVDFCRWKAQKVNAVVLTQTFRELCTPRGNVQMRQFYADRCSDKLAALADFIVLTFKMLPNTGTVRLTLAFPCC